MLRALYDPEDVWKTDWGWWDDDDKLEDTLGRYYELKIWLDILDTTTHPSNATFFVPQGVLVTLIEKLALEECLLDRNFAP